MPVSRSTWAMKSPPLSASRVALVAAAMISSTLCDSASRLNLASVCSAAVHRRRGQAPAVEAAGAEPHHVFFAVDDLEGQVRAGPARRSCGSNWCRCRWRQCACGWGDWAGRTPFTPSLYTDAAGVEPLTARAQPGKSYHEPFRVPSDPPPSGSAVRRRSRSTCRRRSTATGSASITPGSRRGGCVKSSRCWPRTSRATSRARPNARSAG